MLHRLQSPLLLKLIKIYQVKGVCVAHYKRKIYLIDPKFQLRMSIYICFFVFISSLIYPFTIYDLISQFMQFAAHYAPDLSKTMASKRQSLILILALWQLGFTTLVFIIGIFFTHKIAGPIFKMKKHLRMIREGQVTEDLHFRKGDHFQDLAVEFNKTMHKIRDEYKKDFTYLSEVNTYINNLALVVPDDKRPVLNEINQKLRDIQNKFEQL